MKRQEYALALGLAACTWTSSCQTEKNSSRSRPTDGLEETESYVSSNEAGAESTTSTTDGDSSVVIGAGTIAQDFTVRFRRLSAMDAAAILGVEMVSGLVGVEVNLGSGPLGEDPLKPEDLGRTFDVSQIVSTDDPMLFSAVIIASDDQGLSTTYRIPAAEILRQSLDDGRWKLTAKVRETRVSVFFGIFDGVTAFEDVPIADASRRVRIERMGLTGDTVVVRGANLDLTQALSLVDSGPLRIVSKTSNEIVAAASGALSLALGSVANMLVSTAYGDTSIAPVAIESFSLTGNSDGAVTATISNQHVTGKAFYRSSAAGGAVRATFGSDARQNFVWGESAHPLVLSTNNEARVFIDSDGEIGIGNQSPNGALHISITRTSEEAYAMGRAYLTLNNNTTSDNTGTSVGQHTRINHASNRLVPAMFGTWSESDNDGAGWVTQSHAAFNRSTNVGSGTVFEAIGTVSTAWNKHTGRIDYARGIVADVYNTSTGIMTEAIGGAFVVNSTAAGGTISAAKGGHFAVNRSEGTINEAYGVYIAAVQGNTPYSLYAADANAKSYFAGKVEIGTQPTPGNALEVGGDISLAANRCVKVAGGAQLGTCSSDQRFKTGIRPIVGALDRLTALTPVNYHFRTEDFPDRQFPEQEQQGLIAQDVERIYPDLVSEDADGYKRVKYGNELMMQSIAAIKELRGELKELRGELAAKDRAIEELKALVCAGDANAPGCQR